MSVNWVLSLRKEQNGSSVDYHLMMVFWVIQDAIDKQKRYINWHCFRKHETHEKLKGPITLTAYYSQ